MNGRGRKPQTRTQNGDWLPRIRFRFANQATGEGACPRFVRATSYRKVARAAAPVGRQVVCLSPAHRSRFILHITVRLVQR